MPFTLVNRNVTLIKKYYLPVKPDRLFFLCTHTAEHDIDVAGGEPLGAVADHLHRLGNILRQKINRQFFLCVWLD
jgi:hypothetical protein